MLKAKQHQVRLQGVPMFLPTKKRLVHPIAQASEIQDFGFDVIPVEEGFKDSPPGIFKGNIIAVGKRISENGDAEGSGGGFRGGFTAYACDSDARGIGRI